MRKITGAILQGGRMYKAGDEEALAIALPKAQIVRLLAAKQLAGDWGVGEVGSESTSNTADTRNEELVSSAASVTDAPASTSSASSDTVSETPDPAAKKTAKKARKSAAKKTAASKKGGK